MLEVMKQYFNISDLQMSKEINNMHDILVELLEKKGISYSVLKSVLIPQKKHHEIILVFDTLQIEDSEYGVACYNAVIKLLDKSESHSFLCGDYISKINTSWKNANIIRKTKCFDFWERNVLFPKTKRSFFRTPTLPFSA